jgi:hypothetical protein
MRTHVLLFFALICFLPFPEAGLAQTLTWKVNLSKPKTFISTNPADDPMGKLDNMWYVHIKELMGANLGDSSHGICVNLLDPKGYAKLSVYLYDDAQPSGRGPLIYQCHANASSTGFYDYVHTSYTYDYGSWLEWWEDQDEDQPPFTFNTHWQSADAKTAAFAMVQNNYKQSFENASPPGLGFLPNRHEPSFPVIIELTVFKADVNAIKIPGIGEIQPGYFRPPFLNMTTSREKTDAQGIDFTLNIETPSRTGREKIQLTQYISIDLCRLDDQYKSIKTYSIDPAEIWNAPNGLFSESLSLKDDQHLAGGAYGVFAVYHITIIDDLGRSYAYNQQQFLYNFRILTDEDQTVYDIKRETYEDLPVFKLSGGMSSEYAVEKSIADLSSGISETWDVRKVDGKPDLKDGGPVSVYPDYNQFDFLDQSVNKTVDLYNKYFGTAPFETVIIATGVAHVPYLASAMKAPVLPLHFLVSVNSVRDVQDILTRAKKDGYASYATLGYDPSITDIGVAWIKLGDLPKQYRQFLIDHKVKNVILMGYQPDDNSGENGARRIEFEGEDNSDFSDGSIYMMAHGEERTYKTYFKDYYRYNFGQEKYIPDWEGGISDVQIANFTRSIEDIEKGPKVFTIQTDNSANFYHWAMDIQLSLMKKVNIKPREISLNEYLIGFPSYELSRGAVPFLYWQGLASGYTAFNVKDFGGFKFGQFFPDINYNSLLFLIQAKADRSSLMDSLKKYFNDVLMNHWQKADVWDPADGMNSPCELAAADIVNSSGGAEKHKQWNESRAAMGTEDLYAMVKNSVRPDPPSYTAFPASNSDTIIKSIPDAGLQVSKYKYDPSPFWHPDNFPNNIRLEQDGKLIGYLDGQERPHDMRKQEITIASFDLRNNSDEYDLRIAYKFNINDKDGLLSYNPGLGEEQKMDCFEFTSIPANHWFDIPSRVMAREGAVMIFNGGVYDFDYNGIPGVVPFIKKDDIVKAEPQILSYKGEGAFAWRWGSKKSASIVPREKNIPATRLKGPMSTLFQKDTKDFPNVMGGMTFMTKNQPYNYKDLQPQWMLDYPAFPSYYLQEGQRCFFAPLSQGCSGTEVVAPIDEGWNSCSVLKYDENERYDEDVKRFSTLAYRQYPKIFDDVPNARTFVGFKHVVRGGDYLDIGIIAGDYGQRGYRGRVATKKYGMHNYEVSQFCQHMGYDQLVNLDGGSSTQCWINGRGPLQLLDAYPLSNDNQGPYYSRLVSSFIMLVPKFHLDQIKQSVTDCYCAVRLNNTSINWDYTDKADINKDKAFIDLSPSLNKLSVKDGSNGMIAGRFKITNSSNGAVLFYAGEDMHYPDTKGLRKVIPQLKNLFVIGVGEILPSLRDSLLGLKLADPSQMEYFREFVGSPMTTFYYIKVYDGMVVEYLLSNKNIPFSDSKFHSFQVYKSDFDGLKPSISAYFDNNSLYDRLIYDGITIAYNSNQPDNFLNMKEATHCYIGAVNLDGRFLTGNADLYVNSYMFIAGRSAMSYFDYDRLQAIRYSLTDGPLTDGNLPKWSLSTYTLDGVYGLELGETAGQHVFAIAPPNTNRFYGLRVNCQQTNGLKK